MPAFEYILSRTLHRPHDAISFVNECLLLVEGKTVVSSSIVKQAEAKYSESRLASLADEWIGDYPALQQYCKLISGGNSRFKLIELSQSKLEHFIVESCATLPSSDSLNVLATAVIDGKQSYDSFRVHLIRLFYDVGLLGVKPRGSSQLKWAFDASEGYVMRIFQWIHRLKFTPLILERSV